MGGLSTDWPWPAATVIRYTKKKRRERADIAGSDNWSHVGEVQERSKEFAGPVEGIVEVSM